MKVSDFIGLPLGYTYKCKDRSELQSLMLLYNEDADLYCPSCKKERLFTCSKYNGWSPWEELSSHNDVTKYVFTCNCGNGELELLLKILPDDSVVKIGQYPDNLLFDATVNTKLVNQLPKSVKGYYYSAIKAYSAGLYIAAFNYLRRVFEALVDNGELQCGVSSSKNDKMKERIKTLVKNDTLPDILIEPGFNTLYSLLSTGVHELDEQKCNQQYSFLKDAIELILAEQLAKQEQAKRKAKLAKSLSALHSGNNPKS